jgi:FkbM family methyltransferase
MKTYRDIYDACCSLTRGKKIDTIVDLGARHGEGYERFGKYHEESSYVFVEPSPRCIPLVKNVIDRHPNRNLSIIEGILGTKNCLVDFYQLENDDDQSGNIFSNRSGRYGDHDIVKVDMINFKDKFNHIDFVKCNIEGGEYNLIDNGFFDIVDSFVMEAHNEHVKNKTYVDILRSLRDDFELEVWGNTNYKYCFVNGVRRKHSISSISKVSDVQDNTDQEIRHTSELTSNTLLEKQKIIPVDSRLIKHDIFFDFDINHLLYSIKEGKQPRSCAILKISQDKTCLLESKTKCLTSFYQFVMNDNSKETLRELTSIANQDGFGIDFRFFFDRDFQKEKIDPIHIHNLRSSSSNVQCSVIDIQTYDVNHMKKSHKKNVLKSKKLGVESKIYHFTSVDSELIQKFEESMRWSRKSWGGILSHSHESFRMRENLIKSGKGLLCVTSFQGKNSFVFSLVSSNNCFYFDSAYDSIDHPYTGHYAIYSTVEYLKKLGCKYYNLGEVNRYYSGDLYVKKENVDYYKSGFVKNLTESFHISMLNFKSRHF